MTDLTRDSPEVRRDVTISSVTQGSAKTLHLVLNVVTTLIIIRYLPPSGYGEYVLVLTVSMLIGLIADFGLVKLATREISRDSTSENEVLGTVVLARICLAAACIGLLQLVLIGLGASPMVRLAGLVASMLYLGNGVMVATVALYVRIKQQYEAFIQVGMEIVETVLLVVLVKAHASLAGLFIPPSIAAALGAAAAVLLVRRRYGVRFRLAVHRIPYLMREALPLGPALLISICYLKLDALMVAVLRDSRDLGLYGSAYQPVEYTFLAAAVVINVVFPLVAAAYAVGDHARFVHLYRRGAEVLVTVMVLVPVVLSLVAVPLVDRVYGPAYQAAARPLQLLAVTLVVMTLNAWQAFVLLSGGKQAVTLWYNLAALAVATVCCLVLISAFGMIGAALATLCTAAFVFTCSTLAVRRYFAAYLDVLPMARIFAAAVALWLTLWGLGHAGVRWPLLVLAAAVLYPFCLAAFGVVRLSSLFGRRPAAEVAEGRANLTAGAPVVTTVDGVRVELVTVATLHDSIVGAEP